MKFLIARVNVEDGIIEVSKKRIFSNGADALNEAVKLNQLAKDNDTADIFSFMVLPCEA